MLTIDFNQIKQAYVNGFEFPEDYSPDDYVKLLEILEEESMSYNTSEEHEFPGIIMFIDGSILKRFETDYGIGGFYGYHWNFLDEDKWWKKYV